MKHLSARSSPGLHISSPGRRPGLSIMEALTQTKSKGLNPGAQAGSPRLWDGRSWGSCSHSWKKVHADGALDDWKPDASKGRSGYEIMSRELTEQRCSVLAMRGSEMRKMLAGPARGDPAARAVLLLRDQWPGERRCPQPFLLGGCPRSRPAHVSQDAMTGSVGENWFSILSG